MTEPIQWGGELDHVCADLDQINVFLKAGKSFHRQAISIVVRWQVNQIGQFWTEVARLYEEAEDSIPKGEYGVPRLGHGWYEKGRYTALRDILELSKKYPFG